jgi:DNA helicase-2/ATP-dependent DNA helicase PcrA
MELSYTRYRVFRECPWKYRLLFLEGRRIKPTEKSAFGLSLHRTIESWQRAGAGSLESLFDSLAAEWLRSGYADADVEKRWRRKAERALERFHAEEESRRSSVVAVEKEFIWGLGAHHVRGMIDRIERGPDGEIELVDFKTSSKAPTELTVAADGQMLFYALGARRGLALEPALLTVDCVILGRRVTARYDAGGEKALTADIGAVADAVDAGRFEPDHRYCVRCDFRDDCDQSVFRRPAA